VQRWFIAGRQPALTLAPESFGEGPATAIVADLALHGVQSQNTPP